MAYDRKQGGHEVAQSSRPDYRLEVGRAEVPVGAPRGFVVLDTARAATLKAWTSALIPAAGGGQTRARSARPSTSTPPCTSCRRSGRRYSTASTN